MAGFSELADELLVEILKWLTFDKPTLHRLATVNKKLNQLAVQILAHTLEVYVQTFDEKLASKYELLVQSLNKKPYLSQCVRNITIRSIEGKTRGRPKQRKRDANARTNDLLRRLSNLNTLSIHWTDKETPFRPDFLSHTGLSTLKTVTILGARASLEELCIFMSIKSVTAIYVKELDPGSNMLLQQPNSISSNTDLDILDLGQVHLPPSELQTLFRYTSSVTSLLCAMPGLESPSTTAPIRLLNTNMASSLSPAGITQAFQPLSISLVELRLNNSPVTHWPGHDGTRMDLSRFEHLKVLHVPSSCFFKGSPVTPRRDIQGLLPQSLRELKLWFDFDNHFLYTEEEMPEYFLDSKYNTLLEAQHSSRYNWLSDLVHSSVADHGDKGLHQISIQERIRHPRGFCYSLHVWGLPLTMKRVCVNNGLDLSVWLRAPKALDPGLH